MRESSILRRVSCRWLLPLLLAACLEPNPAFEAEPTDVTAVDGGGRDGAAPDASLADAAELDGPGVDAVGVDAPGVDVQRDEAGPVDVGGVETAPDLGGGPTCPPACGPLVHWRFDEAAGTVANDASGNGFAGSYVGEPTLPAASTSVPITQFANPYSRSFPASGRPAVRLANGIAVLGLQTTDELSLSAWFRATAASGAGGDVVNIADSFLIRVKPTEIELAKRISDDPGTSYVVAEIVGSPAHLDGQWHHVAGVLSATGIYLYLDGVLRANLPPGPALMFAQRELLVGRRELGTNNFQGGVDDVRFYRRALAAAEILDIAQGK